jgi:hypothetical protein
MKISRLLIAVLISTFAVAVLVETVHAAGVCRMVSIKLKPTTKSGIATQQGLCPETYASVCNDAVTDLDGRCQKNCAAFKKRVEPPLEPVECKANPVSASTDEFDQNAHCVARAAPVARKSGWWRAQSRPTAPAIRNSARLHAFGADEAFDRGRRHEPNECAGGRGVNCAGG